MENLYVYIYKPLRGSTFPNHTFKTVHNNRLRLTFFVKSLCHKDLDFTDSMHCYIIIIFCIKYHGPCLICLLQSVCLSVSARHHLPRHQAREHPVGQLGSHRTH